MNETILIKNVLKNVFEFSFHSYIEKFQMKLLSTPMKVQNDKNTPISKNNRYWMEKNN